VEKIGQVICLKFAAESPKKKKIISKWCWPIWKKKNMNRRAVHKMSHSNFFDRTLQNIARVVTNVRLEKPASKL
jgi:hypothetical protein